MKNRILSVILICLLLIPCIPTSVFTSDFTGYIPISTPEDLLNIKNNLLKAYYLTNDIDLEGINWEPIGTKSNPFYGILDGNGYSIKNLTINKTYSTYSEIYSGMFEYVSYARICNLTIENCNINVKNEKDSSSKYLYIGTIAGYNNGTIENCHVNGVINGNQIIGGLVGYNNNTISNCTNNASITSDDDAGGIAGYNTKNIKNCSNTGTVISKGRSAGIVYYNDGGTVSNCRNTANLQGGGYCGGIVAYLKNNGTIEKCYNNGDILNTNSFSGGIAGYVTEKCSILNCYNEGNISGNSYSDDSGGIAGYAYQTTISNCYNIGNISLAKNYNANIDGIAGYSSSNTIESCYSTLETTVGTNCSIAELKNQSIYTGFDFETVWQMSSDTEYPLAVLKDTLHIQKKGDTQSFEGGNGTAYAPYEITNATQLDNIRKHPNCHFILKNNIAFEESDFSEGGEFYNDGAGFLPIGDKITPFGGTLDGAGHEISGLYINSQSIFTGFIGFNVGTVKNLKLKDLEISSNYTEETSYTAGITAYAFRTAKIENCEVYGNISSTSAYVGGIVGYLEGYSTIIQYCKNHANISGGSNVGGIAGYSSATIFNCKNNGNILGKNRIGGIAGYSYHNEIKGCSNSGYINGTEYVGGIAGEINYSNTTYCSNAGAVNGTKYLGGIAGDTSYCEITDCFNTAKIKGNNILGGIAGNILSANISRCYNVGIVDGSYTYNGIAAQSSVGSKVTDCLYLRRNEISNRENEYSLEQMKDRNSYTNYDFEAVWVMDENESYPFPVFRHYTSTTPYENKTEFSGGLGTEYSPFIIENEEHFNNIRNHNKAYFVLAQNIVFSQAFEPIPKFYGNIDGCGFALENISITTTYAPTGIFAENNGNIKNLNIKNANVSITTNTVSPHIGILIGDNIGAVSNCVVSGKLSANGLYVDAAAIAGYNEGLVTNCISYAQINSPWNCSGIVGYNTNIVSRCINLGKISGGTRALAAGIVSINSQAGIITNCFNTAEIFSQEESAGITVTNNGTIQNCYNIGTVRSSVTSIGGICLINNGTLENVYHINSNDTSVYGTLCTLEEMKKAETFKGFDFEKIWTMEGNELYPYPELQNLSFENTLIGIRVYSSPAKSSYLCAREELDLTGAKLTLIYDTCQVQISITPEMVSGFSNETVGNCRINVAYNGFTTYFYVYITCEHDSVTRYDIEGHWTYCIYCRAVDPKEFHKFDSSCDTDCNENCGYTRDAAHLYEATFNETAHFEKCSVCNDEINIEEHIFDNACDTDCQCGYTRTTYHNILPEFNETEHFEKCSVCGYTTNIELHLFENACQTACDCGFTREITHNYSPSYDSEYHFERCTVCGYRINLIPHRFENDCDPDCGDCEHTRQIKHEYDNDCDSNCNICNKERAVSHRFGDFVYNNDATESSDGTQTRTCTECGYAETFIAEGTMWTNPFIDVKEGDFYYVATLWAVNTGITAGTSKNTFSPDAPCTRSQIATFLWRAAGYPEPDNSSMPFNDVKPEDYYYKAVQWAVQNGITAGTSKNTFSPNAPCTRSQIATFLWRAAGEPKPASNSMPFKDVKSGEFYYNAVLWAVGNGITAGTSKNTFSPDAPCTRAQIVTFLYRNYN